MTRIAETSFYPDGPVIAQWGGWGILAAAVPSSGASGPALAYPSLTLPAQAGEEVRIELLTLPGAGAFDYGDDTSATLSGAADGTWTATFRVFIGEVDQGIATAFFQVGSAVAQFAGGLETITGQVASGQPPVVVLAGALETMVGTVLVGQSGFAEMTATLDSITGAIVAGVFSFGNSPRELSLVPPRRRTIGGENLG